MQRRGGWSDRVKSRKRRSGNRLIAVVEAVVAIKCCVSWFEANLIEKVVGSKELGRMKTTERPQPRP